MALRAIEGTIEGLRLTDARRDTSLSLSTRDEAIVGAGVFDGVITLCARWILPGGARGPPGRDGLATICTGGLRFGAGAACCRFVNSRAGEAVPVRSRFKLVFLPIDEKNPPPGLLELGVARALFKDEVELTPPVDREVATRVICARFG